MATNVLTSAKIMSYADQNVFSILNNRSYVPDPKKRGANAVFVYRNDPLSKGSDYRSYPYIVLRFPEIEHSNQNINNTAKDIAWTQKITVRTAMGGAVNKNVSTGITNMLDIVDDIVATFNSTAVKDELRLLRMYNLNIDVTSNDEFVDDNNKHIFETELELTYDTRIHIA